MFYLDKKAESGEDEDEAEEAGGDEAAAAKKKKKKKKKKAAAGGPEQPTRPKMAKKQTNPPTIPICELFPDGHFPVGQICNYEVPKNVDR